MTRYHLAAILAAVAVLFWWSSGRQAPPSPAPAPAPTALVLEGRFIGPTAAEDAATLAALCDELASVVAWDGSQPTPRLTTGAALDDLRVAARELRMRGVSIGARQPHARDEIHRYLDSAVGVAGGPIDAAARAAWVTAFREIARACRDAAT